VITAIVGIVILALMIAVVVVIARDRGPGPGDVAVAYELAWDQLDFESVFTLSGIELRDSLGRREFVAAKRAAYEDQTALGHLVERAGVEQVVASRDAAVAITNVELHDNTTVRNRVEMARRNGRWLVVDYQLEPSTDAPSSGG
jgi:hypothetical protein